MFIYIKVLGLCAEESYICRLHFVTCGISSKIYIELNRLSSNMLITEEGERLREVGIIM